ncbi:MAG: SDR family oxidoreductase [Saprospiraceae bacterium]|nr:SDR family oxidoreductase [Candidatus Vicinibacter affinis]
MKNYFVLGASSGIGRAIALQLSGQGHTVYGTYHKNGQVDGLNLKYHELNVLSDQSNFDFLPENLDGFVYCPGNIKLKPFERISPEEFTEDFTLQVIHAAKSLQKVLPRLKKSTQASMVFFSSIAVGKGFNYHSLVSTSKGAIEGLTKSLAAEYAPKIRFNCIAPSLTNTPLASMLLNTEEKIETNAKRHPLKRIGQPEDIASAAAFLLSEESSWMTGQIIHVDGGLSSINL